MLGSRGEKVLEPLPVTSIVRFEGARVVVYFCVVCGLRVGVWVDGVAGSAGGEERLLGAVVVVGCHGGLVLIWVGSDVREDRS